MSKKLAGHSTKRKRRASVALAILALTGVLVLLLSSLREEPPPQYTVTLIETPTGKAADDTIPLNINNHGVVVGAYLPPEGKALTYLWSATGGAKTLGLWLGGPKINDSGQVFGSVRDASDDVMKFRVWSSESGLTPLGDGTSAHASVGGINNVGQVVGMLLFEDSKGERGNRSPFIWDATKGIQVIDPPEGYNSGEARRVNDYGVVLGNAYDEDTGKKGVQKLLWTEAEGARIHNATAPGATSAYARTLNNRGQVIGWLWKSDMKHTSFLWENGELAELGSPEDAFGFWANDLNDRGLVVGTSVTPVGRFARGFATGYLSLLPEKTASWAIAMVEEKWPHEEPYIWEKGRFKNLNDLISGEVGGKLGDVRRINNRGQIIAGGLRDGGWAYFLLTPIGVDGE